MLVNYKTLHEPIPFTGYYLGTNSVKKNNLGTNDMTLFLLLLRLDMAGTLRKMSHR